MLTNRIRDIRKSQNITQKKLAEMVGSSRTALYRIENSYKPVMYADTAYKIAKALGVSMDYLFCAEC